MTREQLIKRKITGYMLIDYKEEEFMLIAVNYDEEILTIRPTFPDSIYEDGDHMVNAKNCEFTRQKLKVTK